MRFPSVRHAAGIGWKQSGLQDSVIARELLRLRAPDHGKLFKALLAAYAPERRKHDLRKRGSLG